MDHIKKEEKAIAPSVATYRASHETEPNPPNSSTAAEPTTSDSEIAPLPSEISSQHQFSANSKTPSNNSSSDKESEGYQNNSRRLHSFKPNITLQNNPTPNSEILPPNPDGTTRTWTPIPSILPNLMLPAEITTPTIPNAAGRQQLRSFDTSRIPRNGPSSTGGFQFESVKGNLL